MKISSRGFTLMELLIVLAIVGGLSAVSLSALSESRAEVRDGKRVTELSGVTGALFLYSKDRGVYPSNLEDLVSNAYLSQTPKDPRTGEEFMYELSRDGSRYYIGVNLETRRSGFLNRDADNTRHGLFGDDLTGCNLEFGYYCYDISNVIQ